MGTKSKESSSGVNFINVLHAAFTSADPKSVRTQSSRQYHFTLLGSARVKAPQKTLMKLTPEGAFTSSQIEKAKEEVYLCLWERERESMCVCVIENGLRYPQDYLDLRGHSNNS